jgi:Uma2 family endonuclease
MTPEELLQLTDHEGFELVDGALRESPVTDISSLVAFRLGESITSSCTPENSAWVFGADCGYKLAPRTVRFLDVSVVLASRLPVDQIGGGRLTIAPDIAVEVISPGDLAYDLDAEIEVSRRAGIRLVWLVNPDQRTVRIHRGDGSVSLLHEPHTLDGEDVLPGFQCRVPSLCPIHATPVEATPVT